MARPTQNTIDYFSHDCQHTKTMYILENRYKNDGYALWFKLLETLGSTPNHFIDLSDDASQEFMAAKANITWERCEEILMFLAKIKAICPDLWENKIVWCQNFIDRLAGVYGKRCRELPSKPSFCDGKLTIPVVSVTETPQSKLNKSKLNKSKLNKSKLNKETIKTINKDHVATSCDASVKTEKSVNEVEIPTNLNTPEFLQAWKEWQSYRRQTRKTLTESTIKKQLEFLASIGVVDAIISINESIKNGYTGLFPVKQAARNKANGGFDAMEWLKNA